MPSFPTPGRKIRKHGTPEAIIDFPAGRNIFDLDHPCRRVYLLRVGRVRLSRGHEVVLAHLTPGNFFGEECFLNPSQRCQSAQCISPVTVSSFRASQLLDQVQHDRRFALRLLKNLALRLDRRGQTIGDFVKEPAERRLGWLLLRLAPDRPASGWVRLYFSPSNAELARTIGTTRGRISYFLRHFRQMGWLERRPELWVRRESLREFLGNSGVETKN